MNVKNRKNFNQSSECYKVTIFEFIVIHDSSRALTDKREKSKKIVKL